MIDLEENNQKKKKPDPLLVYTGFECLLSEENQFVPDMICYSQSDSDVIHTLKGTDCASEFIERMDELTEVPGFKKEREIHIFFHNLKGFDGLFIIQELYGQKREVTRQLTNGCKVLSFQSGSLHFKDSLCFLPFSLDKFSCTFHLTELKKGFFPRAFHTEAHCSYVGPIPDLSIYSPDRSPVSQEK